MNALLKILIGFKAELTEKPLDMDKIKLNFKASTVSNQTQPVSLQQVETIAKNCTKCSLSNQKNSFIFGAGNQQAKLMLIEDSPESTKTLSNNFFNSEAGQLLSKMLLAINLQQDSVYITNIVKCPPALGEKLQPDELSSCNYLVQHQIALIKPTIICTLGTQATQSILQIDKPISQLRGQIFKLGSALLIPTFHPAYLLHSPHHKKESWEDLKLIRRKLDELT